LGARLYEIPGNSWNMDFMMNLFCKKLQDFISDLILMMMRMMNIRRIIRMMRVMKMKIMKIMQMEMMEMRMTKNLRIIKDKDDK